MLETIAVPSTTRQALVHVRDYTKGHPTIAANNHPVRHGSVVGIHNGIISNDEELFAGHDMERHEPEMTVDSEAIFALVDRYGTRTDVLEQLVGAMAAAWIDERDPSSSTSRAAWVARSGSGVDARGAVRLHAGRARGRREALGTTLRKTQVDEGRLLSLVDGELSSSAA